MTQTNNVFDRFTKDEFPPTYVFVIVGGEPATIMVEDIPDFLESYQQTGTDFNLIPVFMKKE